jgi:ribosomal protein L16 Arg81 hydroxylase
MEEVARIGTERSVRAERAAITNYFRDQGLTEEEAKQAFEKFRTDREAQREAEKNDLTALQRRVEEYERKESEILRKANRRLVRVEAKEQAIALGVRVDRSDYAVRLADLSKVEVDENGEVDESAVREALEQILNDFPELKVASSSEDGHGFKLGSPGQKQQPGLSEQIAKIFGNTE